uniref:Uncharacterized protein n=1 Tax=Arundo donax TaxID=35708 RepID=A0A0A9CQS5_ARUDO
MHFLFHFFGMQLLSLNSKKEPFVVNITGWKTVGSRHTGKCVQS